MKSTSLSTKKSKYLRRQTEAKVSACGSAWCNKGGVVLLLHLGWKTGEVLECSTRRSLHRHLGHERGRLGDEEQREPAVCKSKLGRIRNSKLSVSYVR